MRTTEQEVAVEERKLTCDCGCGVNTTDPEGSGWLMLSQTAVSQGGIDPKLERVLHFASFSCLDIWSNMALAALPDLQVRAREVNPRGRMSNPNVSGLYV
jgi:hypothetical protein